MAIGTLRRASIGTCTGAALSRWNVWSFSTFIRIQTHWIWIEPRYLHALKMQMSRNVVVTNCIASNQFFFEKKTNRKGQRTNIQWIYLIYLKIPMYTEFHPMLWTDVTSFAIYLATWRQLRWMQYISMLFDFHSFPSSFFLSIYVFNNISMMWQYFWYFICHSMACTIYATTPMPDNIGYDKNNAKYFARVDFFRENHNIDFQECAQYRENRSFRGYKAFFISVLTNVNQSYVNAFLLCCERERKTNRWLRSTFMEQEKKNIYAKTCFNVMHNHYVMDK